jgi:hypothetical protein
VLRRNRDKSDGQDAVNPHLAIMGGARWRESLILRGYADACSTGPRSATSQPDARKCEAISA